MTDEDDTEHAPDVTADTAADEPDSFHATSGLSYRFAVEEPDE